MEALMDAKIINRTNDGLKILAKGEIKTAVNIAKVTDRKVKESIIFALVVKAIVLLLGIFGLSTIILAVFADVGVTLLVILNVITIFYKKIK